MKLELDLTPAEIEALQATLNHYKHVANEDSLDYLRGSQAQVFYYNASEVLRAISTEVVRQQGGPSFSIGQLEGETSQLRSPFGIWTRDNQQINDIRSAYITYPGLADVLVHDGNMYRTDEQREKYADVPDHVWSEQRGVLQIVAADMGFATELNRKDLSFAQLRQPDGVTPSERYGQQRSISPDRIRKALEARGMGQDSAFVHEASNGIKLAIDQNDDRVEVLRFVSNGDASWRYTSHKETPNGFVPGISNQMSGEERDALMEALTTLEQAKEIDDIDRYGRNEAVLKTFAQGLEQLKQDSPDMVGPGGGAKARIEHNLEILKRTNDELAGRGDGELKELFDQADQIMDKPIYAKTEQGESFFQKATKGIKNVAKLAMPGSPGVEQSIADEYELSMIESIKYKWELQRSEEKDSPVNDLGQNANANFFELAQSAALDHGSIDRGDVVSLELPDGHQIYTWQDSVIISKEINGEPTILYEQERETCHLPGNSETFRDKLSLEVKASITGKVQELDHRALADNFGVDIDTEPDQEISIFDMLSQPLGSIDMDGMDADIPPLTTERHAENKAFFDAIEQATLRQGELKEGFSKLDLGDGLTALAVPGDVVISRQDSTGNSSVLYEQSQDTSHLSGSGETHMDKLPKDYKDRIIGQVNGLTLSQEASPITGPKEAQVSSKKSPVKGITDSTNGKQQASRSSQQQRRSKQSKEADLEMGF